MFDFYEYNLIFLKFCTASLSPRVPYGRLEQFTELVVSPKIRAETGTPTHSQLKANSNSESFHRQPNMDFSSPSGPSSETASSTSDSHQWGGIADLKSLFHHMIKGAYDPVKEQPPLPEIPALLMDSLYRVCGAPPHSLSTISHVATNAIHIYPWSHSFNARLSEGHSSITYGLLSKVPSPKETRDRTKEAMEKKKKARVTKETATPEGEEVKEEEAMVVRAVCHCTKLLGCKERSKGEIHSGRVWVSMVSEEKNI